VPWLPNSHCAFVDVTRRILVAGDEPSITSEVTSRSGGVKHWYITRRLPDRVGAHANLSSQAVSQLSQRLGL
jgi:hypothetical protein